MAQQRTVAVKIRLEAQEYFSGLKRMETETRKTAKAGSDAFAQQKKDLDALSKGALVASAGFTAATVAMIKASADFEAKLSQISALGGEYESNIGRLSNAAFTAGKAFGLSATQVADAQIELAKAGVSAKDILGGALPGALALAAAGQIDVAKATSIASIAMTQFGKAGSDVPHIADLLAASADKSVGSVESVGDALNQSGLVASQFGLSIEDTVGTLTSFSKAGLNGSDAGTSFKTMLLSLASPSKQAQAALDKYNISAYDSKGAFVGITSLSKQLLDGFQGVDQASRDAALSTIFGTDAVRAANVLYKQGVNVTQGFADAQTSAGFATLSAQKKLDNLNGDLQKLGATFQNDLIKSGSAGSDTLRGLAQGATNLLGLFGDLPKPIQGTALGITAVGAAVTLAGAAFLLLTPKIVAAKAAMDSFGISGKGLAKGFGKSAAIGLGVAAITSGIAGLGEQGEATGQQLNLASKSMGRDFSNLNKLFDQGNGFATAFTGISDARSALGQLTTPLGAAGGAKFLDNFTFGITHFADTYKAAEGQFKAFGEQFSSLAQTDYGHATASFGQFTDKLGGGTDAVKQALQAMPAYKDEIVKLLTASGQAATEQNILAAATGRGGVAGKIAESQAAADANSQALLAMSGSAADAKVNISDLSKTIQGFGSATLDARAAQRNFEQAVDDARATIGKNKKTLDITTQAGRDNSASLDNIASSATAAAAKIFEQTGSQEKAAAAIRKGRKDFIEQYRRIDDNAAAAAHYADNLGLIPANVKTAVRLTGADAATTALDQVYRKVVDLDGRKVTISTVVRQDGSSTTTGAGRVVRRASGGPIIGPGPKGKDSVLIYAAPGEHVLTAREVDRMGGQAGVYAFRKSINAYAAGGAIGGSSVLDKSRAQIVAALAKQQAGPTGNSIADAKSQAAAADRRADALTRQIVAAKKAAAARVSAVALAEKAADRAEKIAGDIDGSKKNQAAKKAAQHDVEIARKRVEAAKKQSDAAQDQVEKLRDQRTDQQTKRDDALTKAQKLREDREDFVSQQRRGVTDPLSYIDQLRSMSRDDNFSDARRKQFKDAANDYEKALVDLTKKSQDATDKLDGLKSAADSMRSGITSSIAGGFTAASSKLADIVTDDWTEYVESGFKDLAGVQVATYNEIQHKGGTTTGGFSADAIDAYYANGSNSTGAFANDLQALANLGVDSRLLAEIAGYGVEQGAPIAKALLSGTTAQIASINTNYGRVQDNAGYAAGIVTDANYKSLIAAAQTVADGVAAQIADDSAKLRALIASAFGLTGYAVGTMNASPGLHLVGEKGPELLNFAGGEQVITAARTRALMAGARSTPQTVVRMPDTITVQDASGFSATMQVVADQRIAINAPSLLRFSAVASSPQPPPCSYRSANCASSAFSNQRPSSCRWRRQLTVDGQWTVAKWGWGSRSPRCT